MGDFFKWLGDVGNGIGQGVGDTLHGIGNVLGTNDYVSANPTAGQIEGAQGVQQRAAPQTFAAQLGPAAQFGGTTINGAPQDQFRDQQMALVRALTNQASGAGPSLAQGQLQQATDRNLSQAFALGQSQNGPGGGAALRAIANQRAGISQQQAADSGMLRMQEQMQARNALGQLLAQGRGQDIGMATDQAGLYQQGGLANQAARNQFMLSQAGFGQQANMANLQATLQQRAANDEMARQQAANDILAERLRQQSFQSNNDQKHKIWSAVAQAAMAAATGGATAVPSVMGNSTAGAGDLAGSAGGMTGMA